MTIELTRRDLARLAVAGALTPTAAQAQAPPPAPETPNEGEALTQAVARNVGYALTDTQAKEVAKALKGYPGGFATARAYDIPGDVGPAYTPDTPPVPPRKGRR